MISNKVFYKKTAGKEENMNKETNEKARQLPTQVMLALRGFIGFYLLYLSVELIKDESYIAPRALVIICSVLFAVVGVFMLVWIMRSFIKGEYVGGKADIQEEITEEMLFDPEENINVNKLEEEHTSSVE